MSSLPMISHRLFVAAAGSESTTSEKTARNENAFPPPVGVVTAIPLELLNAVKSIRSDMPPLAAAPEPASS